MDQVSSIFNSYPEFAILISLAVNVLISVLGIIPSYFLTAANITFFGFWPGTIISAAGESVGAIVSFYIYRKGFNGLSQKMDLSKYKRARKLLHAEGIASFYLILSLRLFPFIPSGAVNVFAALGKVSSLIFISASTIGKIPALLIEAYSISQITEFTTVGKAILVVASLVLLTKISRRVLRG